VILSDHLHESGFDPVAALSVPCWCLVGALLVPCRCLVGVVTVGFPQGQTDC